MTKRDLWNELKAAREQIVILQGVGRLDHEITDDLSRRYRELLERIEKGAAIAPAADGLIQFEGHLYKRIDDGESLPPSAELALWQERAIENYTSAKELESHLIERIEELKARVCRWAEAAMNFRDLARAREKGYRPPPYRPADLGAIGE